MTREDRRPPRRRVSAEAPRRVESRLPPPLSSRSSVAPRLPRPAPSERRLARQAERRYLAALLRSRRAVARILTCVADVAEQDDAVARALAERPETLEALARCVDGAAWAPPRRRVRVRPGAGRAAPYVAPHAQAPAER